jgi:hypothetical protein
MDNGNVINSQDLARFFDDYLLEKAIKAKNQLANSQFRQNKRVQSITIDLSEDRTEVPFPIPTQFRSLHVARVYTTSTGATASGLAKLVFDHDNAGAIKTDFKTIQANDSFILSDLVGQCFLYNEAQADTTMVIELMVEMEYRAGSQKSEIAGTVSVTGSVDVNNFPVTQVVSGVGEKFNAAISANVSNPVSGIPGTSTVLAAGVVAGFRTVMIDVSEVSGALGQGFDIRIGGQRIKSVYLTGVPGTSLYNVTGIKYSSLSAITIAYPAAAQINITVIGIEEINS